MIEVTRGYERQARVPRRSANMMDGILPRTVIFAALILVFAASAARANSIVNGSFETPLVPNGIFTNFIPARPELPAGPWSVPRHPL